MPNFINMNGTLEFKEGADRDQIITVIYDKMGEGPMGKIHGAEIDDVLETYFEVSIGKTDREYSIWFDGECGNFFANNIEDMFTSLKDFLCDGSCIGINYEDEPVCYVGYTIRRGEVVESSRHDFYSDNSGRPSDEDIAAIIKGAAEMLEKNPQLAGGLAKKIADADTVGALCLALDLKGVANKEEIMTCCP